MKKIRPDVLYVRDGGKGGFIPHLAIKGEAGDIANLGDYLTSSLGYREDLAMTQKGVTDLMDDLRDGERTVKEAEHANTADRMVGENASDTKYRKVWFSQASDENRLAFNDQFLYNPATDTLKVGNITGEAVSAIEDNKGNNIYDTYATKKSVNQLETYLRDGDILVQRSRLALRATSAESADTATRAASAASADTATKATQDGNGNVIADTYLPSADINRQTVLGITGEVATSSKYRRVWFSQAADENRRAYNDNFLYDPATDTLKVGNVTGTATKANSATKADTATKADSATKADTATKADSATKATTADSATSADGLKVSSSLAINFTASNGVGSGTSTSKLTNGIYLAVSGANSGVFYYSGVSTDHSFALGVNVATLSHTGTGHKFTLQGAISDGTVTFYRIGTLT